MEPPISPSCPNCGKLFSNKSNLRRHLRNKKCPNLKPEKPIEPDPENTELPKVYACEFCNKIFKNSWNLKEHVDNEVCTKQVVQKAFPCRFCNKSYTMEKNLLMHVKLKHAGKKEVRSVCKICFNTFSTKVSLTRHIENVHENNLGSGLMDTDSISASSSRTKIENSKSSSSILDTPSRDSAINLESDDESSDLSKHEEKENKNFEIESNCVDFLQHQCSNCQMTFKTLGNLNKHVRLKICQRKIPQQLQDCHNCGASFHHKRLKLNDSKIFNCANCDVMICLD